ncbi:large subunit ribosomal protein L38e [Sporothrix schenckii 1099-18]|uniref:Large subunit ribosomal protein L38e n=1 Tax=Sporothrix schenckii 1099-18 TaxID=1397361 RepID=A0A0F2LW72_SPOSC|nr:large subunit ribosomal protein L38e [Sporothrix schenckii 1099-18]KJR80745.1 large subunit ribosomal protein L38e [Sporothrix schenckii 1099-18]
MPREVGDIKQFIEICRREDASESDQTTNNGQTTRIEAYLTPTADARIKKSKKTSLTKFKVRCRRNLYTLVLKDSDKADKLKQSLPPNLTCTEVSKKNKKTA